MVWWIRGFRPERGEIDEKKFRAIFAGDAEPRHWPQLAPITTSIPVDRPAEAVKIDLPLLDVQAHPSRCLCDDLGA
ncbi:MAG: hypothetical protein ACLQFT_08125 [Steroidobacteraceae bacterium]|jgi:hypothetical protein